MLTLIRFHSNYLFLTLWCHWLQLPNSILFRGSLLKQYILILHGPLSREFILSPSVSLSNTIQWRIHAGFVDGRGGGPLDPPLVYWLGWIDTVGKLALPIPPQSLRPRCAPAYTGLYAGAVPLSPYLRAARIGGGPVRWWPPPAPSPSPTATALDPPLIQMRKGKGL